LICKNIIEKGSPKAALFYVTRLEVEYQINCYLCSLMANDTGANNNFQELISHCKEYGYIFQSSELYDGLAAVYDYGQNGAQLKKNLRDEWWKSMTQMHDNIVGIDAAIFMHPATWKSSGHVD